MLIKVLTVMVIVIAIMKIRVVIINLLLGTPLAL
jgi:hypothetical protein